MSIINILLSGFCLVFSGLFLAFGADILFSGGLNGTAGFIAAITLGYGLLSLTLLALAWLRPARSIARVAKYSALFMFAAFLAGSFDSGMISGLEGALLVMLGRLLWLNWFALRRIIRPVPRV